jgi:hypothetical protein
MVKMKTEIITIDKVLLYNFTRFYYGAGSCSVRLGDVFNLRDVKIYNTHIVPKKTLLRALPGDIYVSPEICEFVHQAVSKFINQGEGWEKLFVFLDDGTGTLPDSDWLSLDPLNIHIDRVAISEVQCSDRNSPITAQIRLGDCMVFSRVPIYDPVEGEHMELTFINNRNIIDAVNRLIRSDKTSREIKMVREIGHQISSDFLCEDTKP